PTIRIVAVALATAVMGQPSPSGAQDSGIPAGSGFVRTDPHMKMTAPRSATPDDSTRAWTLVGTLRRELDPYRSYEMAVEDGYRPFLPGIAAKETHFTNNRYAMLAAFTFEPEKPTSLLYEREGDGYRLVGAMYTAPASASTGDLEERIPLSFGSWHQHVNVCLPPRQSRDPRDWVGPNARFGPAGSIANREECEAADGRFRPRIFGWMLHIYPWEETLDLVFQPPANHREGHRHAMLGTDEEPGGEEPADHAH
ncbi:MAG: hypothetical protein ACRELU_07145, partial [Gemmatimonadota bacterium]